MALTMHVFDVQASVGAVDIDGVGRNSEVELCAELGNMRIVSPHTSRTTSETTQHRHRRLDAQTATNTVEEAIAVGWNDAQGSPFRQ